MSDVRKKLYSQYQPYNGLRSLVNDELPVETGFVTEEYQRFLETRMTIIDKEKREVPFIQQPAQKDLLWLMSLYLQILILKARKMGFSSTALGVASAKFLLGKNEKCVTMSFDKDAATKQLARAKHYIKSYEKITGTKVPMKYNSKTELVWEGTDENNNDFQNVLRVGTARVDSFGRGDDITYLHLTEVSLADDVQTLLAGVGEALVTGSHSILETTANGYNSYKEFWDKTLRHETGFAAAFYSPLWEYDEQYLEIRKKRLGKLFKQEYPMTYQEAFIQSGSPYFDTDSLEWYLNNVREVMA